MVVAPATFCSCPQTYNIENPDNNYHLHINNSNYGKCNQQCC